MFLCRVSMNYREGHFAPDIEEKVFTTGKVA